MHSHIVRFGNEPAGLATLALLDEIAADELSGHKQTGRYCIMHDGGCAMLPEFGTDDPILVDRHVKWFQGDAIYAFAINGQVYIRALQRVFSDAGKKILRGNCYNSNYKPFEFDEGAEPTFEVFGRVIQYWHGKRC